MERMINVRLYGRLGDAIGRTVAVPRDQELTTVGALRRSLAERFPDSGADLLHPCVRACVDDRLVGDDHPLADALEAEFLPPLSGG